MTQENSVADSQIDDVPADKLIDIAAFSSDPYAVEFDDFRGNLRAHLHIRLTESRALLAQETEQATLSVLPSVIAAQPVCMTRRTASLKRLIDVVGSALLLLLFSLPLAVISVAIRICSPGPILVKSLRRGYGGRSFMRYRFRTTVASPAPEDSFSRDLDNYAESPLGSFLHKSKLQDLPELINVLKGEMSLVGPQARHPWLHTYIQPDAESALLHWCPGIIGETQIRYRAERRFVARQRDPLLYFINVLLPAEASLEMKYINNHSLQHDLTLCWRALILMTMIFRPASRKMGNIWESAEGDLCCLFGTKNPTSEQIADYFLDEQSRYYPWVGPPRLKSSRHLHLRRPPHRQH